MNESRVRFLGILLIQFIWLTSMASRSNAQSPWITMAAEGKFSLRLNDTSKSQIVDATAFCPATKLEAADTWSFPSIAPTDRQAWSDPNRQHIEFIQSKGVPFTLIQGILRNNKEETDVLKSVDVVTLPIDLGVSVDRLRILGTGGLAEARKSAGSYMWMAIVDPATHEGIVLGWMTTSRGSGVFIPQIVGDRLAVTARLDFGRLQLAPQASESMELVGIGWFRDVRDGLEAYADTVARVQQIKLPSQPSGYCTWYHEGSSTSKRLATLSEFAASNLKPFGFDVVQIDDGWQAGQSKNGPRKNFTTHRTPGPYSDGMKASAANISRLSLTPGLWFMPFSGTFDDPFFKDKQDWFAKREDGKPFDTFWGGSCFDLTRKEVQAYLHDNVKRMTQEWGYRYLKMDGLFTGSAADIQYVNDGYKDDKLGNATLSDPTKTNIEALRTGLKIVRQAAGPDVFLLGCCAPQNMRSYGGAFGLVDAMRIGPDNGADPEGLLVGPRYGTRNYFLHGKVWWNDPDPVYVRATLSRGQAELSCGWAAVAGQLTIASDELPRLPADRLDLLKRIIPAHGQAARPVDLFENELPRVWIIKPPKQMPNHSIVALYNWGKEPISLRETFQRLGLDPKQEYAGYEYWTNQFSPSLKESLAVSLAPLGDKTSARKERDSGTVARSCAIYALRPIQPYPQILSTSRHVTQGIVEVSQEAWDEKARVLSGVSKIVANDPYEIRLLTKSTKKEWKLLEFKLVGDDTGKVSKVTPEPGLVRVSLSKPATGQVHWTAQFE